MGVGEAGVFEDLDGAGAGFGVEVAADDLERGGWQGGEELAGLAFAELFAGGIPFEVGVGDDEAGVQGENLGDVALFEDFGVLGGGVVVAEEGGAAVPSDG